MRAVFNGCTIAQSKDTVYLEGNHYFPPESVDARLLQPTHMKSLCMWKGIASYHHVSANGQVAKRAAWMYRHPSPLARRIKNHVAFWNEVEVRED